MQRWCKKPTKCRLQSTDLPRKVISHCISCIGHQLCVHWLDKVANHLHGDFILKSSRNKLGGSLNYLCLPGGLCKRKKAKYLLELTFVPTGNQNSKHPGQKHKYNILSSHQLSMLWASLMPRPVSERGLGTKLVMSYLYKSLMQHQVHTEDCPN